MCASWSAPRPEYLDPESTLRNAQTIVTNVTPEQKKRVQPILAKNK